MEESTDAVLRYSQGFAAVPDELIRDERTTPYHIAVFAALAMHANSDSRAWPSINRLASLCGAGRTKVKETISDLESFGWIRRQRRWNAELGRYDANVYHLSRSVQGRSSHDPGVGHEATQGRSPRDQELDPLNQTHKNHLESGKPDITVATADAVIDYLNVKSGKSFRHTETNRKLVGARLSEGFTQADCERVIDTKCEAWKGTEMDRYLRPETLFRVSKFESYLNEKSESQQKAERRAEIERIVAETQQKGIA